MSKFGWSYPAGAANDPFAPYNQTEQPLDLADNYTLKGHGRKGHGLNGKDADLDYGGQNKVNTAWWFEDGKIQVDGTRYVSIVPNSNASNEQLNIAESLVIDCGYGGEWDGDYWIISESYSLNLSLDWNDELSDEQNVEAAIDLALTAINKDSEAFESDMTELAKEVERATATEGD